MSNRGGDKVMVGFRDDRRGVDRELDQGDCHDYCGMVVCLEPLYDHR